MTTTPTPTPEADAVAVPLLPCPFCGKRGQRVTAVDAEHEDSVFCVGSDCGGSADTASAWNRRAASRPSAAPDGSEREASISDICERLDEILVEESPMHPFGCATWEEASRVAIDTAKDALRSNTPAETAGAVAFCRCRGTGVINWGTLNVRRCGCGRPIKRPVSPDVGPAEPEVGRAVYERIEKLVEINPSPNTSEWVELDYLSELAESVEEYGSYDGPIKVALALLDRLEKAEGEIARWERGDQYLGGLVAGRPAIIHCTTDPNAEVRDPDTGEVIFPARKITLRVIESDRASLNGEQR